MVSSFAAIHRNCLFHNIKYVARHILHRNAMYPRLTQLDFHKCHISYVISSNAHIVGDSLDIQAVHVFATESIGTVRRNRSAPRTISSSAA